MSNDVNETPLDLARLEALERAATERACPSPKPCEACLTGLEIREIVQAFPWLLAQAREAERLRLTNQTLTVALERYGRHENGCAHRADATCRCSCGFDQARGGGA